MSALKRLSRLFQINSWDHDVAHLNVKGRVLWWIYKKIKQNHQLGLECVYLNKAFYTFARMTVD